MKLLRMVAIPVLICSFNCIAYGNIQHPTVDISMLPTGPTDVTPDAVSHDSQMRAVTASTSWWQGVQEEFLVSEYQVSRISLPDGRPAYQAPNRAQNLRTYFTSGGIRVTPRTSGKPAWIWELSLTGYGLKGDIRPVRKADPSGSRNRVRYDRGNLSEWYVNDERGLEQGFTLHTPPNLRQFDSSAWVVLQVDVSGDLHRLRHPSDVISFVTTTGLEVIRYSKLLAFDAGNRPLPAYFHIEDHHIHICVDTSGAIYPVTIDPLAASPNWTDEGGLANSEFGFSVSSAGDVNGDGFDEIIVGAPWYDSGEEGLGRTCVYFGALWGLWDSPYWTASGLGSSVSTAGDVNGDGYADIVIGGYVYYGSDAGLGENGTKTNADWWSELRGVAGTAGDVNGDGFDDIILGRPYYSNGESYEGEAFIYHGSPTGLGPTGTRQNADWHYEADQVNAHFGYSVGSAGDVNGDGYGDVIVGAPMLEDGTYESEQGQAFVFYGSATGLSETPDWSALSQVSFNGNDFGFSVSGAGDVNRDGFCDVIVANPFADDTTRAGQVFAYYGSQTGLNINGTRPVGYEHNADWHVQVGGIDGRFGWSVNTAGDVDGDRYADVVIALPRCMYDGITHHWQGCVYLYRGSADGLLTDFSWSALSEDLNSDFGYSIGGAGDVNGDGYDDVIVGEPKYGPNDDGRAYVYRGSRFKPPLVMTDGATGVTTDSATLQGRVDDMGSALSARVFLEWGSGTVGAVLDTCDLSGRPRALAFDGENVWVAVGNSLTKVRTTDGELLGTYPVGTAPRALAFDGANIWVAHAWHEDNELRKIRAADGQLMGIYSVGTYCYDLAFDGTHVWVTNGGDDTVMKFRASDGKLVGTYDVGDYPIALAFDGTYMWVANSYSNDLMRLRANNGALVATYDLGDRPSDLVFEPGRTIFDGNIWVVSSGDNTIMKFNAYSGDLLDTYVHGNAPNSLAFDGEHMWVSNYENIMKLRAIDGHLLGTFDAGDFPSAMVFDGTDIWVANQYSNDIMRIKSSPYEHETSPQIRTSEGLFSAVVSGLDSATIYHFRARAVGDGHAYGEDQTFAYTSGPPIVATVAATDVTSTAASLNGMLYYAGAVSSVDVSFEWGLDIGYGNQTPAQTMTASGSFSAPITGLVPGNTYHFRSKAVGDGVGYGEDMVFVALVDEVWVDDDYSSTGYNDGHVWGLDAFAVIQEGIDTVISPGTVHVSPGNYYENISMRSGVTILGAGAGSDPDIHSILDGAGLWQTVVTATNVDASATLDGFLVTNGYGYSAGGGMHNSQASPRIANCIFLGNESIDTFAGAGMCNQRSSPTLVNCIFFGNTSLEVGGGMSNLQSSPTIINCTFSGNEATNGGGMFNFQSTPTIMNSIFWGNRATSQGDEFFGDLPVVSYSDIQQSSGTYPGTGNINADPLFADPNNGNFRLQSDSPCVDEADNGSVPPDILDDFEGEDRIVNGDDIAGAIVDMGADEYVPPPEACEGDFNGDGDIDGLDLDWLADDTTRLDLSNFCINFGATDCVP